MKKPFEYRQMKTKAELISDPAKLIEDIKAYFEYCENTKDERELKNGDLRIRGQMPSILGLSQWIPCHINTLNRLLDDDDTTVPQNKELIDAQREVRDILTYARQEMDLIFSTRSYDGDANDRISAAYMVKRGLIGEDKANVSLNITVAGMSSAEIDECSK